MNSRNLVYWTLQILVWSFLAGVMGVAYWFTGNELKLKLWQVILDFSVVTVLSIIVTHQIKIALNKYVQFDNLKSKDIFKILGILIGATILFYLAYILYIRFSYNVIYDRVDVFDHPSQSIQSNFIFIINYCVYFMIWTGFYVAVKGLMQLNKSRETRLQLESNLKESQLNTLVGQINPHFMFNSLNNIRGLMLEDVTRARNMLTILSETLRYSLTKSEAKSIALEDELEMVDNYVEISKIQLEDRLEFVKNVEESALHIQTPPMIVQMLVENAIKHGISKIKDGGIINLSISIEKTHLMIQVANTGRLTPAKGSTKLGLKNIRQRLELLYEKEATFTLNEVDNQVVASIKLPIK